MPAPSSASAKPEDALYRGLTDDLRLAHLLADDADSISMSRFKALDLHVTAKPDLTPVSDADTAVEEALRRTLGRARPRDAVQGEELDDTGWGPRRWVIDPIDGTKNFVRGVPVWATLISLLINDQVVARRGQRPGAQSPLVGQCRRRRVRGQVVDVGQRDPRLRCGRDRGRLAELRVDLALGGGGSGPAVRRSAADLLADPGVRGLLVLHAAGRGRGGHRLRTRARAARHGRLLGRS